MNKVTVSREALIDLLANAYFYDTYANGGTLDEAKNANIPFCEEYPQELLAEAWAFAKTLYDENN